MAGLCSVVAFANVIAGDHGLPVYRGNARPRNASRIGTWNITMVGLVALLTYGWHVTKLPIATKLLRVAAIQPVISRAPKNSTASSRKKSTINTKS